MRCYSMRHFQNDKDCLELIFYSRYGHHFICPACHKKGKFSLIARRKRFDCQCGYGIYPLTGTIFHGSATPLRLWFYAIYIFSSSPNGVAAKELERQLGVTYKTAWRISTQIRLLLSQPYPSISASNTPMDQYPVFENHAPLFSENSNSKTKVASRGYHTQKIMNQVQSYINTQMRSQNREKIWPELRRSLDETHRIISQKYLQSYIDEMIFRYNNRITPNELFTMMLQQAVTRTIAIPK